MQQIAIAMFIKLILGSDIFNRVQSAVIRWADKKIAGAEKRKGVLDELEVIGLKASEWVLRLSIELAVAKLKDYK